MDPKKVLEKFGWKEGTGLGRQCNGMKEPIKVALKTGHGGVGLDLGAEFKDQWWCSVYNRSSKSLKIENTKDGVTFKRISPTVSRKRSAKKAKLCYGGFLESKHTIIDGIQLSDCSKEETESKPQEDSHILTDEQLFEACGGRTAHKAARHGLSLQGKLARVDMQERKLLSLNEASHTPTTVGISLTANTETGHRRPSRTRKKKTRTLK